jgi:hypothetical protein
MAVYSPCTLTVTRIFGVALDVILYGEKVVMIVSIFTKRIVTHLISAALAILAMVEMGQMGSMEQRMQ